MIWVLYNKDTGGIISTHEEEPFADGIVRDKSLVNYSFPTGAALHLFKLDGSTIVRNDQRWITYDSTTYQVLTLGSEEPISLDSGVSKAIVDTTKFNYGQPLYHWKYDGNSDVVEATFEEKVEKEKEENPSFTDLGLQTENITFIDHQNRDAVVLSSSKTIRVYGMTPPANPNEQKVIRIVNRGSKTIRLEYNDSKAHQDTDLCIVAM